jgi:hypothetical protein
MSRTFRFPHERELLYPPMTSLQTIRHSTRKGKRLETVRATVSTARPRTSDIDKPDTDPQAVQAAKQLSQSAGPVLQPSQLAAMSLGGQRVAEYPDLPFGRYKAQPFFHQIDTTFPGLQLIHEEPYIFIAPGFASKKECDDLILHLSLHANLQASANSKKQEALRTSTQVVLQSDEFPWLQKRISELCAVTLNQLQPAKLTRYAKGEYLRKHIDWVRGTLGEAPKEMWFKELNAAVRGGNLTGDVKEALLKRAAEPACSQSGLNEANRHVTAFLYLNNVAEGGATVFEDFDKPWSFYGRIASIDKLYDRSPPELPPLDAQGRTASLSIQPRAGMIVLHFPGTNSDYMSLQDGHAAHQGAEAVAPKYIVQQFIWSREDWSRELIARYATPQEEAQEEV